MSRKHKSATARRHEESTVESFRNDPAFEAEYLNVILEEGDQDELTLALRRLSEAFDGVQKLARDARLSANTLSRTLSSKGNPELLTYTRLTVRRGSSEASRLKSGAGNYRFTPLAKIRY